jgi:uncharacterized beta-barrel protein YwiB (DUF1934 family)
MTEDILVSVKGLHQSEDAEQDEEIEIVSAGKYYLLDGKHYIFYEEMEEETGEIIQNRIILKKGFMEFRKRGSISTTMTFERDRKNTSWYNTPFGTMMTTICVDSMHVTERTNLIEVRIKYDLDVNCEHVARCQIEVRIMAKDSGLFRLR